MSYADAATHIRRIVRYEPRYGHRRTIVKTLCYRVLMILLTVVVAYLIVGDGMDAVNIGIAVNVLKTGTYYLYERLWSYIDLD